MSDVTLNLTPELYTYLRKVSSREPEILQKLRDETRKLTMYVMQISPEQGQLMALLIEILGAKKTLDIGTFTGYSALAVALAMPQDGKVITCDVNIEWTNIAQRFWEKGSMTNKIDLRLAPAIDTLQKLIDEGEAGTFDFAFIDADKVNYDAYYEKALTLLHPGGLIAIDNVLWDGKVADARFNDADTVAIRRLNEKLLKDERVSLSMIPISDGLTLVRKR